MSVLQELLNLGLVDIGTDDSRFEKMQTAASAFATKLKEEPDLLIPSTLIAIDNEVDEDNPLFALVEDMVILEWPTLRNTHVNRPRELLRSIIIAALKAAIEGKPEAAGVVHNTATSPCKYGQARLGKATPVIEQLLKEACYIAETEAIQRAGLVSSAVKKRGKKSVADPISLDLKGAIAAADILTDVERASGPSNVKNETLTDPNPHWPNAANPWSHQFAPRMAATLVKAVNLGTKRLGESLSKSLADYLGSVEERLTSEVRQTEQSLAASHDASRMRLDVLWWSESLYSPSLGFGYREMELPTAAVAAVADLAAIVPALSPVSVNYVLGETILRLSRILDDEDVKTLGFYLGELAKAKNEFVKDFPQAIPEMRLPLLGLVVDASGGVAPSEEIFHSRAGLDISLKLSSGEFAMWVFRDLQARRLVEVLRG